MAKEQIKNNKLTYDELEAVAMNLQKQNAELSRMNEIRDMAYFCLQLLEHKEVLPDEMISKVINFLDRIIPVPKQEGAAEQQ